MTSEGTTPGRVGGSEPRPLDPRVLRYWWVRGGIRTVILSTMVMALDLGILFPRPFPSALPPGWTGGLLVGILLLLAGVVPPLRYRFWRFAVREEELWIRKGILIRTVTVIPYRRLQFVDTSQGPLARAFRLAELVVYTAAAGVSGRIPGLDMAEAEALREDLARMESGGNEPV